MKKIFVILFICPLFSIAQDCGLHREKDPFTKEVKLSTGFINLEGGSVTVDADQREIDIMFTIFGADKCYDNNSTAWVFFEGVKTKMTSRNGGTMNCEGLFHFIFKNTASLPTILQKLMSEKTNRITFTGNNKKETTITVKPEVQDFLIQKITCLVNEAAKLVKTQ